MRQINFNKLLDEIPLYTKAKVSGFLCEHIIEDQSHKLGIGITATNFKSAKISEKLQPRLYCDFENCKSHTYFEFLHGVDHWLKLTEINEKKVSFRCCNCRRSTYTFFLEINPLVDSKADNTTDFEIQKIGQIPRHGKRIPTKASKIIGKERDLFFKGSLSENQGLGIGAFSYYRRVLDLQKDKIFDEVIKVLKLTSRNEALVQELTDAKAETQFTKAVDKIQTALPDGLLIGGHNPLKLLYSALSQALHSHTDEECLELAQDIKVVLFEFSEKLDSALKESVELNEAVNRLARKN
ncbi:hypothetical protein [Paraglaciecola sp. 25GB23A]|uniref:hypothetical protein n=1 Tax=Paraglaciecola sp. 25GB23A TaxID=3156068 RepID=UPI0032AFF2C3